MESSCTILFSKTGKFHYGIDKYQDYWTNASEYIVAPHSSTYLAILTQFFICASHKSKESKGCILLFSRAKSYFQGQF